MNVCQIKHRRSVGVSSARKTAGHW